MRALWSLLLLPGCFVAVPPPAGMGGVTAGSVYTDSTPLIHAAGEPLMQAGSVALVGSPSRQLSFELRGEASTRHVATAPGVWVRMPFGLQERWWVGARPGAVLGTGELGDYVPFDNPYLGPSLDAQIAYRFGSYPENPGAIAITLGAEYTVPLYGETHPRVQIENTVATPGGQIQSETHSLELLPGVWVPLELRAELPIADRAALTLTGGLETYAIDLYGFWRMALGVRVPLGKS